MRAAAAISQQSVQATHARQPRSCAVADSPTTTITQNQISTNGDGVGDDLGIDLGGDDVTLNDGGDGDTGPNGLLNFPQMPPPIETTGILWVDFGLDVPAGSYRVEFFKYDKALNRQ